MSKNIVICDDEAPLLRATEIKLLQAGFTVFPYDDGLAAWEHLEKHGGDLLITDLQMPRMDGAELCQRVRQHTELAKLPVIMLTAKGYEEAHTEFAQRCGVSLIMTKPFSPREVVRRVQEMLNLIPVTTP